MKNNFLLIFFLVVFPIFFANNIVFSQESSCDKTLNNAIKLFNAKDYQNAKKAFEIGYKNCENKKTFQDWIKKCEDILKMPDKPDKPVVPEKQATVQLSSQNKPNNSTTIVKQNNDKNYYNATLELPSSIEFASSKETKEIDIVTNYHDWSWKYMAASPAFWISIKTNKTSLTVTCDENRSLRDRKEYVTVVAGNKNERIAIIQKGKIDIFPVVKNLLLSNLTSNSSVYSNTNKYKGERNSAGQRNGLGAQLWSSGDFSFGVFSNGECTNGIYIDGDLIVWGRAQANKYQVGNFFHSNLNGEGRTYGDDGALTFMGNFNNDEPAYGENYWIDSPHPELRFDIIQNDFGYYFGETINGEPHGKGIFIHINKDMWYGDWLNGNRFYGIEIRLDGTVNVGTGFEALDKSENKLLPEETIEEPQTPETE
jgi:hypothetical protein